MPDQDVNLEDVSAMRREGDFKAFMRQAIRTGQHTQRKNLRPAAPSLPSAAGHIPGAWPVGPADPDANNRTTCICDRCQSYAKGQPERNRPSV